jgi:hypothetical protein
MRDYGASARLRTAEVGMESDDPIVVIAVLLVAGLSVSIAGRWFLGSWKAPKNASEGA